MNEFTEFPKIARFSREAIITEKIDGTNAQVCITEDGQISFGSRSRWITPENDNYGFARWATEHKEELLKLGPGVHFGEWWGNGIQRGYGVPEKWFSLFNVTRWCLPDQKPQRIPNPDPRIEKVQEFLPTCVGLVPVLWRGPFDYGTSAVRDCLESLRENGSVAAKGFMKPEGVILFHIAGNVGFKKTIEKDDEPKGLSHVR